MRRCENKDSHLLRQSLADLGPAPNIITESKYAYGVETELFVNYAMTPNIEVGAGVRYWGLASRDRRRAVRADFAVTDQLNNFDQQRYGVLAARQGQVLTARARMQRARIAGTAPGGLNHRHERPARRQPQDRSGAAQSDRRRCRRQRR